MTYAHPSMPDIMQDVGLFRRLWVGLNERIAVARSTGVYQHFPPAYIKAEWNGRDPLDLTGSSFTEVATFAEATVAENATIIQSLRLWNGLLKEIYNIAPTFVVMPSDTDRFHPDIRQGKPWPEPLSRSFPPIMPSYGGIQAHSKETLCANLYHGGLLRRWGEEPWDASKQSTTDYFYSTGDILWSWIWADVYEMLRQLRVALFRPNAYTGQQKDVFSRGRSGCEGNREIHRERWASEVVKTPDNSLDAYDVSGLLQDGDLLNPIYTSNRAWRFFSHSLGVALPVAAKAISVAASDNWVESATSESGLPEYDTLASPARFQVPQNTIVELSDEIAVSAGATSISVPCDYQKIEPIPHDELIMPCGSPGTLYRGARAGRVSIMLAPVFSIADADEPPPTREI